MPFPPDAPCPPPHGDAANVLPLRGLTLLAVEDSRFACDALRLICIRSGARLRRAGTLAAARSYLRAHRPDVVIVDLGLPDGRGEGLIADLVGTGLPVLGTSGDPEGRALALASGAAAFLDKPIGSIAGFQRQVLDLVGYQGIGGATPLHNEAGPTCAPAADMLAFRDDLAHASALMAGRDNGYATRFLRSLGRSAGDHALEAAALAAVNAPEGASPMRDDALQDTLARLVAARLAKPLRVA